MNACRRASSAGSLVGGLFLACGACGRSAAALLASWRWRSSMLMRLTRCVPTMAWLAASLQLTQRFPEQVADIVVQSLTIFETPVPVKVARLYLISDILSNSACPLPNAVGAPVSLPPPSLLAFAIGPLPDHRFRAISVEVPRCFRGPARACL